MKFRRGSSSWIHYSIITPSIAGRQYEFEQNIPPILKRSDRDFWKTKLVSSTNVRISNVRRIPDRILSFVRVREARDDIRQNFNPNLKIELYENEKRFESLIVIRSIVSSFPKNLRESV